MKEEAIPPMYLYHGTSPDYINDIRNEGLLPKSRQYVHLSQDMETARLVGKRKNAFPVILTIDTKMATEYGSKFYLGNEMVWLADKISSNCISFTE